LALAKDLLITRVQAASECANVIKAIEGAGRETYGHTVREIKSTRLEFESASFVYENRMKNKDAHMLARSAIGMSIRRHLWLIAPPDGICNSFSITA
jgi:hypothetical protein